MEGRPRSWPPAPEDALSRLLWQPYELQRRSVCDVPRMSEARYVSSEAQTDPDPRRLPDLLDSALPPPYPQQPIHIPFHILPARRRGSVYREVPKSCCGLLSPAAVSLRWLMLLLLTVGVCCALVGTVLGATRATAPHHLTIALLMIGVGVVLVTVSGVAWRLLSQETPTCQAMLGLSGQPVPIDSSRRFFPRLPPTYAMMYPEFQYRAPPPSYQASMQEYRLRLLLLDRRHAASPPPTYRSHPTSLARRGLSTEYSRPPSYRSRTSSARPTIHSRQASSESDQTKENMVTVVRTEDPPPGPVILTISGPDPPPSPRSQHMEILAHL